jgi:hypothetical protein
MNEDIRFVNEVTVTSSVSSVTTMTSTTTTAAPSCEDSMGYTMDLKRQRVVGFFTNEMERYVVGDPGLVQIG